MTRKWVLSVPSICYNIDAYKYLDISTHIEIYVRMHVPNISQEDKSALLAKTKYLRFMCFQDEEDSDAYMYAYCRDISEMSPDHYAEAAIDKLQEGYCLGEINYATSAYFFVFDTDAFTQTTI